MSAALDTDLLRTLVAVAERGSVTQAADVIGRTQSAVSMQIKKLEEAVGEAVFERRARGVALTRAGEVLVRRARPILTLLEGAAEGLGEADVVGNVRVGVPEEYAATALPTILSDFVARHPSTEVTVRTETTPRLEAAMRAGHLDLSVLVVEPDHGEDEVLFHDPAVWATSRDHLAHEADPLPVAMFDYDCWWRHQALRTLEAQGRAYRIAFTSPSTAGIQAAVTAGLAVGLLGRSMVPNGARALTPAEGFRDLAGSSVVLRMAPGAAGAAARGMAETIRRACQGRRPAP